MQTVFRSRKPWLILAWRHKTIFSVTINVTGHLRDLYPKVEALSVIECNQPVTVAELIDRLGISSKMVLFATISERIVSKDYLVDQECVINLISPPAGG
jgi:sulfur carrier protein ThiS